jgi:D-alanine-D-alanine ligase
MTRALETSRALERATVAVLLGGVSSEREVSLVSGREVLRALADDRDGRGPAHVLALEIDAHGRWLWEGHALEPAVALTAMGAPDALFNALHGGAGEDGTLQGFLDLMSVPCTGSGVRASAVSMDKVFGRAVARGAGLAVARGLCVSRADWPARARDVLCELAGSGADGWVVKPRGGGSSLGVSVARTGRELALALAAAHALEEEALVEERLVGIELTCGVLVDEELVPRALPPIEIRPKAGRFFDYEEKYSPVGAQEICPPENVRPQVVERVRAAALAAHAAFGCQGYSRSDFILPAGADEPVFLELNTLPGLTPRSLVPQSAAVIGVDYRSLCLRILSEALARPRGVSTRAPTEVHA